MKTDLQERVTRNVKVLMALRGISDQKTLAAKLGWGADRVSTSFSGRRRWALDDLDELAAIFGLTPGDLLRDPAELVQVPSRTGTEGGVSAGVSGRCPRTNPRVVIPFPQAGKMRRGYHSRQDIAIKRGVRPPAAENNGHPHAVPVA